MEMYRKLLFSEYVKPFYRRFFDVLLQNTSGAVLWHCSAGKDRAGVASMLIRMALGVPRENILKDYMMTGVFTRKEIRRRQIMIRWLVHDKRQKECYRALLSVKEKYLQQLFDLMDRDYGGEMGYLSAFLGISEDEIRRLRELYLCKG